MKYGKRRIATTGLVAAFVAAAILVPGFVPSSNTTQATAAVGGLTQTSPTVKIAAEPTATSARIVARTRTAATIAPAAVRPTTKATRGVAYRASTSELAQAKSILAGLIAKHPILRGTTVTIGATPGGYQAVSYYKSGRIVISPTHAASLSRILNHEVWHVIDWRDNGRIDWGENVPPN